MKRTERTWVAIAVFVLAGLAPVLAATPPNRLNYQGVLRDASNTPLDGNYDVVFRLWDSAAAGNEILVDQNLAANAQSVTVTGGLFNAEISAGQVIDGSGPGFYAAGQALVATSGVVLCFADASFGPIAPGDLLTTSSNPGHAARADEALQGAILGKAMEALPEGTGLIRVLVR